MSIYKITVFWNDGTNSVLKDDEWNGDPYSLWRGVDKGEIKAFKVALRDNL